MAGLLDILADHLRARTRNAIEDDAAVTCAVLIPLMPASGTDGDDYEVVYTLRSEHLPSHKGQVAFPGGRRHGGEESIDTALRESSEEIGIVPHDGIVRTELRL